MFALSGCAGLKEAMYHPSLSVTQGTPGSINVGAAKKLTFVQFGQARAALREKLAPFAKPSRDIRAATPRQLTLR